MTLSESESASVPEISASAAEPQDVDTFLEAIKPLGRYQIFLILIFLYAMFPLSVNNGFMAFDSPAKFLCNDYLKVNASQIPTDDCQIYYNCSRTNLTLVVEFFSVAHEWLLICDRSYLVGLITSVQMVGDLVGAVVIGYVSDSYGRKWTFVIILSAQLFLGGLSSLSNSWPLFAVFRFFIGFCAGAEMVAGWVLVAECTTNRYRYLLRAIATSTFDQFDSTLVAYLTRGWKWFAIIGNLQAAPLLLLLIFFTYESPRWLAQKGRLVEAEIVLRKIASINGARDALPAAIKIQTGRQDQQAKRKPWDLFRKRQLAVYTVVCVLTWFTISTINSGMFFDINKLPANIYFSMAILGAMNMLEVPLAFYDAYNPKLNRKWTLLVALGAIVLGNVGVSVLLTWVPPNSFPHYDVLVSIISVATQLAVSIVFSQAYLYAIELFPTLLRSTAGSLCSVGAHVGAIVAPQILHLHKFWPAAPYLCFATMAFVGVCIDGAFLPNTKNMHLPETFDDGVGDPAARANKPVNDENIIYVE